MASSISNSNISGCVLAPALALSLASSVWLLVLPINFDSEAESQASWSNREGRGEESAGIVGLYVRTHTHTPLCAGTWNAGGTLRKKLSWYFALSFIQILSALENYN